MPPWNKAGAKGKQCRYRREKKSHETRREEINEQQLPRSLETLFLPIYIIDAKVNFLRENDLLWSYWPTIAIGERAELYAFPIIHSSSFIFLLFFLWQQEKRRFAFNLLLTGILDVDYVELCFVSQFFPSRFTSAGWLKIIVSCLRCNVDWHSMSTRSIDSWV